MTAKRKAPLQTGPLKIDDALTQDRPGPQDWQGGDAMLELLKVPGLPLGYALESRRMFEPFFPFGEEMGHPTMGGAA